MLEYEETNAENPKPSISFEVAEPADNEEKDWKVTIISAVPVSCTCTSLLLLELFDFHLSSFSHALFIFFVSLYVPV